MANQLLEPAHVEPLSIEQAINQLRCLPSAYVKHYTEQTRHAAHSLCLINLR